MGKNNPQRKATKMIKREMKWAGTLEEEETSVWRTAQSGVAQIPLIGNGCSLQELG